MGAQTSAESAAGSQYCVSVNVVQAKHLSVRGKGSCDAYVEVVCGDNRHQTQVRKFTNNPIWNDRADFVSDDKPERCDCLLFFIFPSQSLVSNP
jgi:hypothetical protein